MGVPDQPSHCGSNKPTFSQIKQAVPEICAKSWRWWQQLTEIEQICAGKYFTKRTPNNIRPTHQIQSPRMDDDMTCSKSGTT